MVHECDRIDKGNEREMAEYVLILLKNAPFDYFEADPMFPLEQFHYMIFMYQFFGKCLLEHSVLSTQSFYKTNFFAYL